LDGRVKPGHDIGARWVTLFETWYYECIFKKRVENHGPAMALHFIYDNFGRIHQTLKMTPAMAAGVTKRLWETGDILDV
jgi:hypothetical protein